MATVLSLLKLRFGKDIAQLIDKMVNQMYQMSWSDEIKKVNKEYHSKFFETTYVHDDSFGGLKFNKDEENNPGWIDGMFNHRDRQEVFSDEKHSLNWINCDRKRGRLPKNY